MSDCSSVQGLKQWKKEHQATLSFIVLTNLLTVRVCSPALPLLDSCLPNEQQSQRPGAQAAQRPPSGGRLAAEVGRESLRGAASLGDVAAGRGGAQVNGPPHGGKQGAGVSEPLSKVEMRRSDGDTASRDGAKYDELRQGRLDAEERSGGANAHKNAGSRGDSTSCSPEAFVQQMPSACFLTHLLQCGMCSLLPEANLRC